jgi:aminopeptidase-like protein
LAFGILPFELIGCDMRQFCSPCWDLPVGVFPMPTPNGECPEHGSSPVNLNALHANSLSDSLTNSLSILDTFEHNGCLQNDFERFDVVQSPCRAA